MDTFILDLLTIAAVTVGGTLFMLALFAFTAIIVTKLGEGNIVSKGIIIVFSVINAIYNITLGSILCFEGPKGIGEPTTKRLQRYKKLYSAESKGIEKWRGNLAQGGCDWLNLFEPDHC